MIAPILAPSGAPLQDQGGCLTAAGLAVLRAAAAGQAPQTLAAHLAGCARCQKRVIAVVLLAAIVAMLATLRHLAGGP